MTSQHQSSDIFAIAELLEAILLQLDIKTLLVTALRVSRSWHQLITSSPALQRALYFQPVPETSTSESDNQTPASENDEDGSTTGVRWAERMQPILNPLLAEKFGCCFFDFGPKYGFYRRADSFKNLPWATRPGGDWGERPELDDGKWTHFMRKGASWRRMLVSQPSPAELGCIFHSYHDLFNYGQYGDFALIRPDPPSSGLRMGHLYDIVQRQAGRQENYSVWFRITWNEIQEPFEWSFARTLCSELLNRTSVVLEINHQAESANELPRQPVDGVAFDRMFRCEEFERHEFQTTRRVSGVYEFRRHDCKKYVYTKDC